MTKLDLIEENLLLKIEDFLGTTNELNEIIAGLVAQSFELVREDNSLQKTQSDNS